MSYENQTTYVDTESSKMLANAITGIGQVTAKYISDDVKKRAKIAEENKIENKKRDQAFKRNQIAGQENVNEYTGDLNFAANESFREATSGVIDRLARAKADYEFSTEEGETAALSKEIYQLDTFLKKSFKGQMDDLQADVEKMREIMNNPGAEGGLDQFQDSNYTTMLIAMAQGKDPGEMSFEMNPDTQNIEMTLKGDMYNSNRQDDSKGIYKVSLKGNQSTEIAQIPTLNMRTPTEKGGKSVLQTAGVLDDQGQIPVDFFSEEIGESKDLANNTTLFKYKINETAERKIMEMTRFEVAGMLKGGEGLAGGFTGADSYYRNVLLNDDEANGNVDGVMPFLETGSHEVKDDTGKVLYVVPVTEESYNALVERISKREIDYVNSMMKPQTKSTVSTSTGGKGTKEERNEQNSLSSFSSEESVSIASGSSGSDIYNQIKNNPSSYDYDPSEGFTSTVRTEKDYKDGLTELTAQELHDQGILKFDESELKKPDGIKAKEKINNFLATLGDDENKFVNYNNGSPMDEKQALVALYKSTPKYANLKPSQIEDLVNDAMGKRAPKKNEEFSEDVSRFQTDNIDDVESGEFSKEYASATEEINPASRPMFSQSFNKDKYKENKKQRSKLITKQKKDRKLLEDKYPNVSWPWQNN